MALPSSGTISISQINAEFGRGNNLGAYRGTSYYTSSGGPFSFPSGSISMSDFYGTRATAPVTISLADLAGQTLTNTTASSSGGYFELDLTNIGFIATTATSGTVSPGDLTGAWCSPLTTGIGSSYWCRIVRTAKSGPGTATDSNFNLGQWTGLSSTRYMYIDTTSSGGGTTTSASWSVQISSSSSGSPVVASGSITLVVVNP